MFEQYSRNVVIIRMAQVIGKVTPQVINKLIKVWLLNPAEIHIVDFSGIQIIDEEIKFSLITYGQILRKYKKFYYSINMDEELEINLRRQETIDFFMPHESLDKVPGVNVNSSNLEKGESSGFILDANYLQTFISKSQYVMENQLNLKTQKLRPYLKGSQFDRIKPEVTSLIEIKSPFLKGWIAYTFTKPTFFKIYKLFIGEPINTITEDSLDVVCELLNITYGCIKQELNKKDTVLEMSIPTKVTDTGLELYHEYMEKSVVVPLQCKFGYIGFEITVEKT